jgi:hypothetical protein
MDINRYFGLLIVRQNHFLCVLALLYINLKSNFTVFPEIVYCTKYVCICIVIVVGIAMDCGPDGRGSNPSRAKILLFSTTRRPALPPIKWVPLVMSLRLHGIVLN